ncbi:hypothetical protein [uncultured Desulfobacter sp.]|uniref:hypothetical protein n=2 Tax=uncultured Desulfobacter sp. TaxID=240139 RepID=UPI0029F469A4|nr:hypothetical protein [uncultured Desulfobacter sp.]
MGLKAWPLSSPFGAILKTMNLTELMKTLPNGFHDAIMKSVLVDYQKHEVHIELIVWVGDLDAKDEKAREAYKEAVLIVSGLFAWVIDPPDLYWSPQKNEKLMIDIGSFESLPDEPPVIVPSGLFGNWIYVTNWNAFIYCVAKTAKLKWQD